jgi:two-component system, OmpR family, response regulator
MRVLVVEDDPGLRTQISQALHGAGFTVDTAPDGEEAQFLGDTEPYDAVVLDLGLPKKDGLQVLAQWRSVNRTLPVLILSVRDAWHEKVAGFDAGADDYLAKPFRMEELIARLRALIRRSHGHVRPILETGPIRLDTSQGLVTVGDVPVTLTAHELKILSYLMHRKGGIISRTELTEHIYERDFDLDSNTIDVFIGRLRRKLGTDLIHTHRGQGYRMAVPDEEDPSQ